MSKDMYLDKLSALREASPARMSPLLDFLEMYRPTDEFDGETENSSEDIKIILGGMVELEINDIATVMVALGYKTVYFDYEYYWNMQFVAERVSKGED